MTTPTPCHREVEIKLRLSDHAQFQRVLALFSHTTAEVLSQINYFFDTPRYTLKKADIILRMRDENGQFFLTLKGPDSPKRPKELYISSRLELEIPISDEQHAQIVANGLNPLAVLRHELFSYKPDPVNDLLEKVAILSADTGLKCIGSFSNERHSIPLAIEDNACKLEVDKTTFFEKTTHYEIELEVSGGLTPQRAHDFLDKLLSANGISYEASNGKSDRFYQMLATLST